MNEQNEGIFLLVSMLQLALLTMIMMVLFFVDSAINLNTKFMAYILVVVWIISFIKMSVIIKLSKKLFNLRIKVAHILNQNKGVILEDFIKGEK